MSLNQYLQLMFKFSNEIGMKGALNSGDKNVHNHSECYEAATGVAKVWDGSNWQWVSNAQTSRTGHMKGGDASHLVTYLRSLYRLLVILRVRAHPLEFQRGPQRMTTYTCTALKHAAKSFTHPDASCWVGPQWGLWEQLMWCSVLPYTWRCRFAICRTYYSNFCSSFLLTALPPHFSRFPTFYTPRTDTITHTPSFL